MAGVTVGIDIGTTSVKAVAADASGRVRARARVPHRLEVPAADRLQHDPDQAWRRGVRRALREVADGLDVRGVNVAAMVPSLCAVDGRGRALTPGLLYGDARGRADRREPGAGDVGELLGFLRWCAAEAPDAAGYWPAQAVANHALGGEGVMDSVTAMTALPLFTGSEWDPAMVASAGIDAAKLARVVPGNEVAGEVRGVRGAEGVALAPGTIDAFGEQLVAGADGEGDALVILGTTLIVWAVIPDWVERAGVWTIPHTAPGKTLIGGPSNAGGLFLDWALSLAGRPRRRQTAVDPAGVPVWEPFPRGERVPLHDPDRRAALRGLDLTHGPAAVRRAAFEASGFAVRHLLDLGGAGPERIVATGGGVRVEEWVQAVADATGLPVDVVAVPEGGALGAAYLARVAAGLEPDAGRAAEWARISHRMLPDPVWQAPMEERYRAYREAAGPPGPPQV